MSCFLVGTGAMENSVNVGRVAQRVAQRATPTPALPPTFFF